ncbi:MULTISPECIES: phosphopantetheine-binding protein [Desulfobacter]|jgi:acyl carrier protein|uniref:Phosphopantetheine-containing protein n=1 Tax=Desulfobacter postgatei 2ac9 TaxID=879212 RepID=I5B1X2_9BACT|nr:MULTISPECIES: phosphopantetheine-binding protein [Desulfobacter]EIM63485.1 phosphopantetheine-containing protein [Desulfobacter postgatei 2ac9]MBP8829736.1 acyl carrier protein [Desulfobacter sp.]MDD4274970.1 phosphopantetheine-binding protein [Desulfobacter postgatei]MDX9963206.1 phosphopantetheine-binding protein [Desulfobacter postgatei]HRF90538.1 phosphopantetheine-binding protein [Desulfobacter postgatei]
MDREEIQATIINFIETNFEMSDVGLDDDLNAVHGFDSIDAIELLREIETLMKTKLTRDEEEAAMTIRTVNEIVDFIEKAMAERA